MTKEDEYDTFTASMDSKDSKLKLEFVEMKGFGANDTDWGTRVKSVVLKRLSNIFI